MEVRRLLEVLFPSFLQEPALPKVETLLRSLLQTLAPWGSED